MERDAQPTGKAEVSRSEELLSGTEQAGDVSQPVRASGERHHSLAESNPLVLLFEHDFLPEMVGLTGLEPAACRSRSDRATNCATAR